MMSAATEDGRDILEIEYKKGAVRKWDIDKGFRKLGCYLR